MHITELERLENAARDLDRARAEVTRLEAALSAAQERLKHAAYEMVLDCGATVSHTSIAAGVHPQTMHRWIAQERHLRRQAGQMDADPFR